MAGSAGPCGPGEEIWFSYKVSAPEGVLGKGGTWSGGRKQKGGQEVGRKRGCGLVGAQVLRGAQKKVGARDTEGSSAPQASRGNLGGQVPLPSLSPLIRVLGPDAQTPFLAAPEIFLELSAGSEARLPRLAERAGVSAAASRPGSPERQFRK